MFTHGPSCLSGPVSRLRRWWMPLERPDLMDEAAENHRHEDRPIRRELVERVRREIAAGTYETPEKLEAALARLLDRLSE